MHKQLEIATLKFSNQNKAKNDGYFSVLWKKKKNWSNFYLTKFFEQIMGFVK